MPEGASRGLTGESGNHEQQQMRRGGHRGRHLRSVRQRGALWGRGRGSPTLALQEKWTAAEPQLAGRRTRRRVFDRIGPSAGPSVHLAGSLIGAVARWGSTVLRRRSLPVCRDFLSLPPAFALAQQAAILLRGDDRSVKSYLSQEKRQTALVVAQALKCHLNPRS